MRHYVVALADAIYSDPNGDQGGDRYRLISWGGCVVPQPRLSLLLLSGQAMMLTVGA